MFYETPVFDQQNIFRQPYDFKTIREYQQKDLPLKQRMIDNPTNYQFKNIDDTTIVIYIDYNQNDNNTNKLTFQHESYQNDNINTTKDCRAVESNTNCRAVDEIHQRAVKNNCRAIENRRRAIINKQKDQRAVNENSHQRAVIENINNDDQSAIIREKIKTNNPKIKIHKDTKMRNEPC